MLNLASDSSYSDQASRLIAHMEAQNAVMADPHPNRIDFVISMEYDDTSFARDPDR